MSSGSTATHIGVIVQDITEAPPIDVLLLLPVYKTEIVSINPLITTHDMFKTLQGVEIESKLKYSLVFSVFVTVLG